MIGQLKQLQPRVVVVFGCSFLALAGLAGLVAWLGTVPPPDQLAHVTGHLDNMTVRDSDTGAFTITLVAENALSTFNLDDARALVAHPSGTVTLDGERIYRGMRVAIDYYAFGRAKKVVAVTLGTTKVLSYDDVARVAAEKFTKNRNSAVGFGISAGDRPIARTQKLDESWRTWLGDEEVNHVTTNCREMEQCRSARAAGRGADRC